jgi:agmatine/peptidylarginine deiminase
MKRTATQLLLVIGLILSLAVCAAAHNLNEKDQIADLQAKIEVYREMGSLPIELTPEEMSRLGEIGIGHRTTAPPIGPPRNPAEWEPMTGAIIRWPLGIPVSLIAEMSEDLEVYTIVANSSQQASATSTYQSGGVNMANAFFIIAPTNSIWTRDYGPWFIFDGAGNYGIVDHVYNRPRPLDDLIPGVIGTEWSVPVYGMDLTTAGGNHMSDGLDMSMSTRLVYDENPGMPPRDVDAMMKDYLGNDYTVLEYIESGGIHHIDCWAKFLDPTTILIKDVSPGHPSYDLLNARADFLATKTSAWGRPYTIVRVYCPYGTAYTNSIILNDKVFVPIFSSSWDDSALQVYEQAMPGYEVLGFYGSWYDNDAIHCRVMGVTDRYMLFVDHVPLFDTEVYDHDYLVSVEI